MLVKDDFSGYRQVFFKQNKGQTAKKVQYFINLAEKETGNKVKIIRSDNGKEFLNKEIKDFCESKGIRHQTSVGYTPQQNGKAERDNRTIVEAARSLLQGANLDKNLWAEAVNTAVYVINRTGKSPKQETTPYELWYKIKFDISQLKFFGSHVSVHIPTQKRKKWDPKSVEGIFVCYDENTKGFRIYLPQSKRIEVARDVIFTQAKAAGAKSQEHRRGRCQCINS